MPVKSVSLTALATKTAVTIPTLCDLLPCSPARASLEPGVAAAKLTLNLMLWRWEPIAAQLEL